MRLIPLTAVTLAVAMSLSAQDWQTMTVPEDGFRSNFPGQPTVENITYETENWIYYGNEDRPGTVNKISPKIVAGIQGTF